MSTHYSFGKQENQITILVPTKFWKSSLLFYDWNAMAILSRSKTDRVPHPWHTYPSQVSIVVYVSFCVLKIFKKKII
jgi:hypothetical protein